jgi:DNA-binding MarR family transcriptional regulator
MESQMQPQTRPAEDATPRPGVPEPAPGEHGELAASLRSGVTRLTRRLRAERPAHGLTMSQISALFTLCNAGALTPRALADQERVQPPAMTRIVAILEERQLVTRTDHPTDGRQVVLRPSPAGVELVIADRASREAWLAARLDELPPGDVAVLRAAAAVLDRLSRS